MKTILTYIKVVSFYAFLPGVTLMSWYTQQDKGPHGGTIKKADGYYIEMKIADKFIYAYLLDAKLKTFDGQGISGDVKFFLADNTSFDVGLKPFAENAFAGESIPGFSRCTITFNIASRTVSARFENQKSVVQKD